jgi:hypothetical protein
MVSAFLKAESLFSCGGPHTKKVGFRVLLLRNSESWIFAETETSREGCTLRLWIFEPKELEKLVET